MQTRHALPAAALLLTALTAPAPAGAAQPACGTVITQSLTLEADLVCPDAPTPALVVGAAGITIDLGGHAIRGDLTVGGGVGIGIDGRGGHDGVKIRNGTVEGFGRGIVLHGASDTRIRDMQVGGAGSDALTIEGGARNAVVESLIQGRGRGILVVFSNRLRIARSTVTGAIGSAISLAGDRGDIVDNTLGRDGAKGTVTVAGAGNRVAGNVVRGAVMGGQIVVASGAGNVVARNWVIGSRATPFTGADTGILVVQSASGTRVVENVSVAAGEDGIDVEDPTAHVARNTANDNGDLGIEAVPGVRGNGNRATGNGNPAQCLNVACSA